MPVSGGDVLNQVLSSLCEENNFSIVHFEWTVYLQMVSSHKGKAHALVTNLLD